MMAFKVKRTFYWRFKMMQLNKSLITETYSQEKIAWIITKAFNSLLVLQLILFSIWKQFLDPSCSAVNWNACTVIAWLPSSYRTWQTQVNEVLQLTKLCNENKHQLIHWNFNDIITILQAINISLTIHICTHGHWTWCGPGHKGYF